MAWTTIPTVSVTLIVFIILGFNIDTTGVADTGALLETIGTTFNINGWLFLVPVAVIFMIVKKDYDQSIDRFDSIKKYCSRYLRKGENPRSNCFINMLLQIPASNFHKARVEQKAKRYWDKLLITPLEVASQATEIEIIPYEDLWQFVLDSLEFKTFER